MANAAETYLEGAVNNAIDYCREEFKMTYAQAIGILAIISNTLMIEEPDEDKEE